eukprot:sb/3476746/
MAEPSGITNLDRRDPFADVMEEQEDGVQKEDIHIRIQQRNGRKTLTTIQGISQSYDLKRIIKAVKKEFHCNGTVVDHPEYGEVLQLQGDQRKNVKDFLSAIGIARIEQIKVHGF